MRFGIGTLTTPSMALQEGDQVFMLVSDDIVDQVTRITGTAPDGGE
jgi:trk system potassium uptake protein TrkA